MPINEFIIWFSLGTLAVGLDKVTTTFIYGAILIFIGIVGSGYGIREHLRDSTANWSRVVAAFIIVATWSAVGYDIYDRHRSTQVIPTKDQWAEETKVLVEQTGDLSHRTVPLDGYRLVNCNIDGSMLMFEGKLPSELINCTGSFQIGSHNPAIQSALEMMAALCSIAVKQGNGASVICKPEVDLPALPNP